MSDKFNKLKKAISDRAKENKHKKYNYIGKLSEGLKPFQDMVEGASGGLYGYLGNNEQVLIEAKYLDAKTFSNGLAPVAKMVVNEIIAKNMDKQQSIFGKLLGMLEDEKDMQKRKKAVSKELKYGFINSEDKVVIDFIFDEAYAFSEGYSVVRIGVKWFLIDSKYQKKIEIDADRVNYPCLLKNGQISVLKNERNMQLDMSDLLK